MLFTVAWENSRHVATPPLVSPRNDAWERSAEIPYWWRVTTQIWVHSLKTSLTTLQPFLLVGFLQNILPVSRHSFRIWRDFLFSYRHADTPQKDATFEQYFCLFLQLLRSVLVSNSATSSFRHFLEFTYTKKARLPDRYLETLYQWQYFRTSHLMVSLPRRRLPAWEATWWLHRLRNEE